MSTVQKELRKMAGKLSHADVEICNRTTEMSYQAFLKANPLKANHDEENV